MAKRGKSVARTLEDLTLDSGYGGAADSFRSSNLSLCCSEAHAPHAHGCGGDCCWHVTGGARGSLEDGARGELAVADDAAAETLECCGHCARLPELEDVPWSLGDVERALRRDEAFRHASASAPPALLARLSALVSRALARIAREARRLSARYAKCTRYEVQSAARIVLSWTLSAKCAAAALGALSLYSMSTEDGYSRGKSERCGLALSVGHFFRWMVESGVAVRVHEHAAIYLTACMERLFCEVFGRALRDVEKDNGVPAFTLEAFEQAINNDSELYGLLQPYQHLICGKNVSGKSPERRALYSNRFHRVHSV
ncbi:hypothetical protein AOLI_G00096410 [Acnodon oligacanthus]